MAERPSLHRLVIATFSMRTTLIMKPSTTRRKTMPPQDGCFV